MQIYSSAQTQSISYVMILYLISLELYRVEYDIVLYNWFTPYKNIT